MVPEVGVDHGEKQRIMARAAGWMVGGGPEPSDDSARTRRPKAAKISAGADSFGSFRWERIAESKCVKSIGPGTHKGAASRLYSGSGFPAPGTEVTCW